MLPIFCTGVYGSDLGSSIIRNGLAAYAVCQHWGNAPEQFEPNSALSPSDPAGVRFLGQFNAKPYGQFTSDPDLSVVLGVHAPAQLQTSMTSAGFRGRTSTFAVFHDAGTRAQTPEGQWLDSKSLLYHYNSTRPGARPPTGASCSAATAGSRTSARRPPRPALATFMPRRWPIPRRPRCSIGLSHHQGAPPSPLPLPSPLALDLSSDRVRLGLHLIDGIRQGQALGALLGYRLERSLHDAGLDTLIAPLRAIASLNNPDPGTAPAESVAASNVVDGLALLRTIFVNGSLATGSGLPTDDTTRGQLTTALSTLSDALDSVADLGLAESVHQLLRGNTVRAGATLDAIARGDVPPPELEVVQTPRAGTGVTHRLLAVASASDPPGWTATPRALAEPRLNALAGTMLGDPARVHARASLTSGPAGPVPIEFGLDTLGISPLDLLAWPESSGLPGELADRLVRAAVAAQPAPAAAGATVTLLEERDPAWTPDVLSVGEFLELARKISRLVAAARALTPQDLTLPGATPGSIDTTDLQTRADHAEAQLRFTLTTLTTATTLATPTTLGATAGLDTALVAAANSGIPGAFPSQDPAQWSAQVATATTDVQARIAVLDGLASAFVRSTASDDARRVQDTARLNAVFGDNFLVLPALDSTYTAQWGQLWGSSTSLQGDDPLAAGTWFQRMARLRPGVERLDAALLYAEALAGTTLTHSTSRSFRPPPAIAGSR